MTQSKKTVRKIRKIEDRVYKYHSDLIGELEKLGSIASGILGYEVVAEICGGCEIEFRTVSQEGYVDADVCIRFEDIINAIYEMQ